MLKLEQSRCLLVGRVRLYVMRMHLDISTDLQSATARIIGQSIDEAAGIRNTESRQRNLIARTFQICCCPQAKEFTAVCL